MAAETKTIRNAVSKHWTIRLKGREFSFTVKFYRYASFVENGMLPRSDFLSFYLGYEPIHEDSPPPKVYEMFETEVQDDVYHVLKKTHFCDRVRLSRSEWLGGFQEIRLNLSSEVSNGKAIVIIVIIIMIIIFIYFKR